LRRILKGLLAGVALSASACGGVYNYYFQEAGPTDADPYLGTVDVSALDAKYVAPRTGYVVQSGYAHGTAISFYNFGTVAVTALPKDSGGKNQLLPSLVTTSAYDATTGCKPAGTFDPVNEAYWRETQFPIFSGLPLAPTSTTAPPVIAVVKVFGVSGVSGDTCNDLKTVDSVTANKFGAKASDTPTGYELRVPIDSAATLPSLPNNNTFGPDGGWYRGLLFQYLNGGAVPVDTAGNLLPMEGVLVSTSTTTSTPTTPKAILLPAGPGEPGYSPIIRLHEFKAAAGKALGDYTTVCTTAASPSAPNTACTGAASEIDVSKVATVTNLVFIVGSKP